MNNGEPEIPPQNPVEVPPEQTPPEIPPGGPLEEPQPLPEAPPKTPTEVPPAPTDTSDNSNRCRAHCSRHRS
jgi:hypothetical protein